MSTSPRILLVVAPYYTEIVENLVKGATAALKAAGADVSRRDVPGALELPIAIRMAAESDRYDGFVALGCVIRGETSHYDTVSNESARGLMDLGTGWALPIGNGILTVETEAQAIVRADPDHKNKGGEAAEACLALIRLRDEFEDERPSSFAPESEHIQMATGGDLA